MPPAIAIDTVLQLLSQLTIVLKFSTALIGFMITVPLLARRIRRWHRRRWHSRN